MTQPDTHVYDPVAQREAEEAAERRIEARLIEHGEATEEDQVFVDYFSFEETKRWYFPNKKYYIEFQPMTEGKRRAYQSRTIPGIRNKKATGDTEITFNPARDREALIANSVCGWYIERRDEMGQIAPVAYNDKRNGFAAWIEKADPQLVESLEKAIRKANPWLQSDKTVADVDAEIEALQELRKEILDRELGEAGSSNK